MNDEARANWANGKEVTKGEARVIYDAGFYRFPGGGYSSQRDVAVTVAENMDRIIQNSVKPKLVIPEIFW